MGSGDTKTRSSQPAAERLRPSLPRQYKVVREIGRGPSGVVYLARHRSHPVRVAVKVLRSGDVEWDASRHWHLGLAGDSRCLDHGNIVRVYCTGEADGEYYVTREYVLGQSLRARIAKGPMELLEAVAVLKQAADGVAYAHDSGCVHGGLKPTNILLDKKGWVYVSDFCTSLTGAAEGLRPSPYIAPERASDDDGESDRPADIYALGAILYEMLTGSPPRGDSTAAEVRAQIISAEAPGPRWMKPEAYEGLAAICLKATAKDPEARYDSALELRVDLDRWTHSRPLLAPRPWRLRRLGRWFGQRWLQMFFLPAFLVTLFAMVWHDLLDIGAMQKAAAADRLDREAVRAAFECAGKRTAEKEWVLAIDICARVVGRASNDERACLLQDMSGAAMEVGGGWDGAIEAWKRIIAVAPVDWKAHDPQFIAEVMIRDFMRGHPSVEEAVREGPEKADLAARWIRLELQSEGRSPAWRRTHEQYLRAIESFRHP